ncbi:hypothetical protein FQA39_LY06108 [Lamprigera yunnana]|nr:hypothetical protein FQA39_LY06108 [Lamprigera yunnana]
MKKRQWLAFLCIFVCYLLFAAFIFHSVEFGQQQLELLEEEKERYEIEDLIRRYYPQDKQQLLFEKISNYSQKPLGSSVPEICNKRLTWDYYNSVLFVLTIVSTIGFNSLSPTTIFTRAFMIIFGIIGIPLYGVVIISIGNYFGKTFRKVYQRWKKKNVVHTCATLSFIAKIVLSSIPGFVLLIVIPTLIIVAYEGWSFDIALEFTFGTLTTIGIGLFVPGAVQKTENYILHITYKVFILVWIFVGLGYLAMFFGFISDGFQSKNILALEKKLTKSIKRTNKKIRKELRFLLNEHLFIQTYSETIYRKRRINTISVYERSQSCPNLSNVLEVRPHGRKRAISTLPPLPAKMDAKMNSDTDLERIDKIRTFEKNIQHEHNKLLIKVVNALSNYNDLSEDRVTPTLGEINSGFVFDESEHNFMLEENPLSTIQKNTNFNNKEAFVEGMHPKSEALRIQESSEIEKYGKVRSRTLPPIEEPESLFQRLQKSFRRSTSVDETIAVVDNKKLKTPAELHANNDGSLSDFLRALSIINFNERPTKQQKTESSYSTSTSKVRRLPIVPTFRRFSVTSTLCSSEVRRRYSESYSSSIQEEKSPGGIHKILPQRVRTLSVIDAVQKLTGLSSRPKSSVVINIDL